MPKKLKITFIKSPTGAFKLAYSAGDTVELDELQAREMMETNFAVPAMDSKPTPPKKQTATAKPKRKETRNK